MNDEEILESTLVVLSSDQIRAELAFDLQLDLMEQAAQQIIINDEDSARQALSCGLQARKLARQVDESRKKIVRPHIDFQRAVMKMSKDISEKLEAIETRLHNKLTDWIVKQDENPFTQVSELEVEDGKLMCKESWGFDIEFPDEVPKEYFSIDEDKIEKAVAGGMRNIPGLRIFKYKTTHMRVKNQ